MANSRLNADKFELHGSKSGFRLGEGPLGRRVLPSIGFSNWFRVLRVPRKKAIVFQFHSETLEGVSRGPLGRVFDPPSQRGTWKVWGFW